MLRYIVKRLVIGVVTIFLLITITFLLVKAIPGNPFNDPRVPEDVRQKQYEYYGLDKPVLEQYLNYMNNLLHGDLGTSIEYTGLSVKGMIAQYFPVSATLGILALIFGETIGLLFGVLSAQFKGRWPDTVLMFVAILGVALPSMVVGPLMRYFIGVKLDLLPVAGWGSFQQMIMPAFVLGLTTVATQTRAMRASMLGISTQDYIKTARAKGLHPVKVVCRHELKNSLVPLFPNLGIQVANILIGSFVVEELFLIPGLGKHFVNSINSLDYPLVMGLTIFYGAFIVAANLITDILYGLVDPRIRLS